MSQHAAAVDALLRFDEALAIAMEIVSVSEAVYGPSHPQTARARNALAVAHDRLGHDEEARDRLVRLYDAWSRPDDAARWREHPLQAPQPTASNR